jgi:hypothetical protein
VICIGASHARRLQASFKSLGANAKWLETKNWRSLPKMVTGLQEELTKAMSNLDNPLLVFCNLDNTYFQTAQEDGSIIPHSRRPDGSYHVDGDLICGPAESAKKNFMQLVPLFRFLAEIDKILTVPVPRYLWGACCDDLEHAPNTHADGYVDSQMKDLDGCNRLWKGLAHREKIRNIKICNAGSLLMHREMWQDDPVHPSQEAYDRMARYLVRGILDLEDKRKKIIDDPEPQQDSKRPRMYSSASPLALPPLYRPAWMNHSGNFITASMPRMPFRGRG